MHFSCHRSILYVLLPSPTPFFVLMRGDIALHRSGILYSEQIDYIFTENCMSLKCIHGITIYKLVPKFALKNAMSNPSVQIYFLHIRLSCYPPIRLGTEKSPIAECPCSIMVLGRGLFILCCAAHSDGFIRISVLMASRMAADLNLDQIRLTCLNASGQVHDDHWLIQRTFENIHVAYYRRHAATLHAAETAHLVI